MFFFKFRSDSEGLDVDCLFFFSSFLLRVLTLDSEELPVDEVLPEELELQLEVELQRRYNMNQQRIIT